MQSTRHWPAVVDVAATVCIALLSFLVSGCRPAAQSLDAHAKEIRLKEKEVDAQTNKTGVLLVSHGSHSPSWRKMLLDVQRQVEPRLLTQPGVAGVKSAFMEYSEPSIATQLRAFDEEGYSDVVLVPLLLTVSSHSFDDIPTIIGAKDDAKAMLELSSQGIERYSPVARVTTTPLLEFSSLLDENLPRRIATLSLNPAREGVVLVAYGDATYNDEWEAFFAKTEQAVCAKTGVASITHCWCGHIVNYSKSPVKAAVQATLEHQERAIVIPVLVARDERFQDEIIGEAVKELALGDRVVYRPDAILPDKTLEEWIITIVSRTQDRLAVGLANSEETSR